MADTIFHKIVAGEVPAYTIYEDDFCMAFLDIYPTHYAQVVLIPKQDPQTSQFTKVDTEVMQKLMAVAQKISQKIEDTVEDAMRCTISIEGLEVEYFHVKILPYITLDEEENARRAKETDFEALQKELQMNT